MTEESSTQVIEWNVNDTAIAEVAEQCKDIDAYKNIDEAKLAKKALTKMRTALGEAHKETKAEALAFGRKVDAEKNRLLAKIREIEDPISEQLEEIKNAELIKEQQRIERIEYHLEILEAFANDRYSLTLDELRDRKSNLNAVEITEEIYQEQTERATLIKQDGDMKLGLAIHSEKERLEEEAKAAEQAEENRKLKEKLEKMEAEQRERDAADALARAEELELQRKKDAERQAELDKQAAELAAEKKRIADEEATRLRAIKDEEAREQRKIIEAQQAEDAAKLAALQAPDIEKCMAVADCINALIATKPVMGSTKGTEIIMETFAHLTEIEYTLRESAEELK